METSGFEDGSTWKAAARSTERVLAPLSVDGTCLSASVTRPLERGMTGRGASADTSTVRRQPRGLKLDTDAVITVAITFVVLCVCPLLAGWIAERKGRQVLPWALLGIIGGVFATCRGADAAGRNLSRVGQDRLMWTSSSCTRVLSVVHRSPGNARAGLRLRRRTIHRVPTRVLDDRRWRLGSPTRHPQPPSCLTRPTIQASGTGRTQRDGLAGSDAGWRCIEHVGHRGRARSSRSRVLGRYAWWFRLRLVFVRFRLVLVRWDWGGIVSKTRREELAKALRGPTTFNRRLVFYFLVRHSRFPMGRSDSKTTWWRSPGSACSTRSCSRSR